jgi:hypothetical protein
VLGAAIRCRSVPNYVSVLYRMRPAVSVQMGSGFAGRVEYSTIFRDYARVCNPRSGPISGSEVLTTTDLYYSNRSALNL